MVRRFRRVDTGDAPAPPGPRRRTVSPRGAGVRDPPASTESMRERHRPGARGRPAVPSGEGCGREVSSELLAQRAEETSEVCRPGSRRAGQQVAQSAPVPWPPAPRTRASRSAAARSPQPARPFCLAWLTTCSLSSEREGGGLGSPRRVCSSHEPSDPQGGSQDSRNQTYPAGPGFPARHGHERRDPPLPPLPQVRTAGHIDHRLPGCLPTSERRCPSDRARRDSGRIDTRPVRGARGTADGHQRIERREARRGDRARRRRARRARARHAAAAAGAARRARAGRPRRGARRHRPARPPGQRGGPDGTTAAGPLAVRRGRAAVRDGRHRRAPACGFVAAVPLLLHRG